MTQKDDGKSVEDSDQRMDEVLRRMLSTPPDPKTRPQKPAESKSPKDVDKRQS